MNGPNSSSNDSNKNRSSFKTIICLSTTGVYVFKLNRILIVTYRLVQNRINEMNSSENFKLIPFYVLSFCSLNKVVIRFIINMKCLQGLIVT